MVSIAIDTATMIKEKYNIDIKVINARRLKPIDEKVMNTLLEDKYIFTMEDGVRLGGFSSILLDYVCSKQKMVRIMPFAFENEPIEHGNVEKIYERYGFTKEKLTEKIYEAIK